MDPLRHVLDNVFCLDANSQAGFKHFEVNDIFDLLSIEPRIDLQGEYVIGNTTESAGYLHHLSPVVMRKVETLQSWFASQTQPDADDINWFALSSTTFRQFSLGLTINRMVKTEEPTPDEAIISSNYATPTPTPTPTPSNSNKELESFQRSIKRCPNDYNKFKDDSRWKQWNRHLKATANSHGLTDILNSSFVPTTTDAIDLFNCQQKFMYSVFEQCLQTTKSKHIVQLHEHSWDAQKVYANLVDVYEEDLSASLVASDLRSQITILRLDDKWKKGIETFLQFWLSKILELEQIEDSTICDVTKRQWLVATLSASSHMSSCIKQAQVTELAMLGIGGSTTKTMPWDNFFKIILAHAKLIDHGKQASNNIRIQSNATQTSKPTSSGRGGGSGSRSGGRGNPSGRGNSAAGRGRSTSFTERVFTTVSGPNMHLTANMKFHPDEWSKLTQSQKDKVKILRNPSSAATAPNSINYQAHVTLTDLSPPDTNNRFTFSNNTEIGASSLRSDLSNHASRNTPTNSTSSQITINGQTYQRLVNTAHVKYHVNNASTKFHNGSLIDGGANGGMSGADVRVIETTFNKADVTGLAEHSVADLPISTVAGLIETSNGPIIGIFHQYAHLGTGRTIHSTNQLKSFGLEITDTPRIL